MTFFRRLLRRGSRKHSQELTRALREQSQIAESERHIMQRQRERADIADVLADTWKARRTKDADR